MRPARLGAALLVLVLAGCALPKRDGGWTVLIDRATGLENWTRVGDANWRARDGAIEATSGTGYLVSRERYRDVRVRAEFWAGADANSGIFLRVQDPGEITPASSYEVNIFDRRPDPSYGTGAIVGFAPVPQPVQAGGRWNTYDITIRGARIVVVLNGRKTVDIEEPSFASGPIALQAAGGTIRFRRLEVQRR